MCFCFQVEPNTRVFPAVFLQPTSTSLFQFELGKLKVLTCPLIQIKEGSVDHEGES